MTGADEKHYALQLIDLPKPVLLSPSSEWRMIEKKPSTLAGLLLRYVAILAAIPEIAHLIGQSLIGAAHAPLGSNLLRAVIAYLVTFAMVYLIACIIDLLAPRFGGQKNFPNAVKLSVYSHTPLWLAGIFLLIPGLSFLMLLGVYGFYLFWVGLPLLMRVKNEQALLYAVIVTGCALVPAVVLSLV